MQHAQLPGSSPQEQRSCVAEAPPEPRRSQAVAEGGLIHKRARKSKDIGDTGTSRTELEQPGAEG